MFAIIAKIMWQKSFIKKALIFDKDDYSLFVM